MPKPLPLGEVARHRRDGEGKPVSREPPRSDRQARCRSDTIAAQSCLAASLPSQSGLRPPAPPKGEPLAGRATSYWMPEARYGAKGRALLQRAAASRMRAAAKQTLGAATRAPSCHIRIASAFIQKHKVTCLESRYKAVPVFSLLRHIGNAPVHWHEETFSSGGILLSDENATVFLTSSDLQPVAPTQTATLNAICFFFDRIKIFQASIPQAERISYTVLFHALPV